MREVILRTFREVKRSFVWAADEVVFGKPERWDRPVSTDGVLRGDCDDFALECRHRLRLAGVPSTLAVVASTSPGARISPARAVSSWRALRPLPVTTSAPSVRRLSRSSSI